MVATAKTAKRTARREQRRQQLIDATMKCIARKGMGSTTLADVAGEAGLSQGIVNLHFESKDNLLNETLRYLADEYKAQFNKTLEKSGPDAAAKLRALIELDLRPSICDRRKIAVWFAFWGEVKSRPTYRKICDERDQYYDDVVERLASEIIAEGKYKSVSAESVAIALTSMTNGLWLSCLISPRTFDRHKATDAVFEYLCKVFPKHFSK
ncbi:MAG: TetR family transcriptional regulator C-terminal domain-containing protein [Gammaproteobacteria bacterium]|nr:TetR family transcriptional regulator C-terminal domain-containing protein [Gammaproteobacteria bacterium]MBU2675749.1 TetR family transcriptional regulator C-terminal domain-containing protein [Gammaproteobacteria bacterium]NNC56369.1 TetR family transcriptional regulator [Woeseiaceae bacterium]NNL49487.1 TetR family transcriptional regulator [Woeseiaceae bacterium]